MLKYLNVFLIALLVVSCSKKDEKKGLEDLSINTANGAIVYKIEVAEEPQELMTGLMNRESLAADGGMIFSINPARTVSMWMKDTKISLDMLFVTPDGKIVWIAENAEPMSENQINTPTPVRAVIEINAGDAKKHNIKIGDTVKFKYFNQEDNKTEAKIAPEPEVVEEQEVVIEEIVEPQPEK